MVSRYAVGVGAAGWCVDDDDAELRAVDSERRRIVVIALVAGAIGEQGELPARAVVLALADQLQVAAIALDIRRCAAPPKPAPASPFRAWSFGPHFAFGLRARESLLSRHRHRRRTAADDEAAGAEATSEQYS